jgi:hypothetical protein
MPEEALTGTFEIHIFVTPLDPPADVTKAFQDACRGDGEEPRMKGLLLNLDYEGRGFIGVLQSSRYVRGTLEDARAEADEDARILSAKGFDVVRKKIEAVATSDGVPHTADDARHSPADRYFEFHLLIDAKSGPISNENVASLRSIAQDMSTRLQQPVPLSYNALKPGQRFLNLRARGVGLDDAMVHVRALEGQVAQTGVLGVVKVISEYICFDDNRDLDNGWLEPMPSAS